MEYIMMLMMLAGLVTTVSPLYTTIATWDKRCFLEDVPDNTMITYTYDMRLHDEGADEYAKVPSADAKMFIEIHRMNDVSTGISSLKRNQRLMNGAGKLVFFAEDYGEYKFCIELHPREESDWEITTGRLHLEVNRHFADEEQENIDDTKETIISTLQRTVRKVKHIRSEQKYYKIREQEFREISYLTSNRVIWYGLVTALTVILSGFLLTQNMKSFFLAKKLV